MADGSAGGGRRMETPEESGDNTQETSASLSQPGATVLPGLAQITRDVGNLTLEETIIATESTVTGQRGGLSQEPGLHVATTEEVILTPIATGDDWTILQLERKRIDPECLEGPLVAGGSHEGQVVKRQPFDAADHVDLPCQAKLDFTAYLVDQRTGKHSKEKRSLRFWFRPEVDPKRQKWSAQEYFKELINPEAFPRTYMGFITRLMKLMRETYTTIARLEVHWKKLTPSPIPAKLVGAETDSNRIEILTEASLLEMLERAFPHGLAFGDVFARCTISNESDIDALFMGLTQKGLIKLLDNGTWIRWSGPRDGESSLRPEALTTFTVADHMPTLHPQEHPTIAVFTASYCEKLAVDAMLDKKEDFYIKCDGMVYTLGYIGRHRIVSAKLPAVGHEKAASIVAAYGIDRLLGIFHRVEHVFIVGCAGAVPHFTSYQKHVRLGDVVTSAASGPHYVHCGEAQKDPRTGMISYAAKFWRSPQQDLQMLACQLTDAHKEDPTFQPWVEFIHEGMEQLSLQNQEMKFGRPPAEADQLLMDIGETGVVHVSHPQATHGTAWDGCEKEMDGEASKDAGPRIHLGPIGGGHAFVRDEITRQDFAKRYGCLAFDNQYEAVLQSVLDNQRDHYNVICIRGMCDYRDGLRNEQWRPYASLAAAAFMKAIILSIPTFRIPYDCRVLFPLMSTSRFEGPGCDFFVSILAQIRERIGHSAYLVATQYKYNANKTRKIDSALTILVTIEKRVTCLPIIIHEAKGATVKVTTPAVDDHTSQRDALTQLWMRTRDSVLREALRSANRTKVFLVSSIGKHVLVCCWYVVTNSVWVLYPDADDPQLVRQKPLEFFQIKGKTYAKPERWMWRSLRYAFFWQLVQAWLPSLIEEARQVLVPSVQDFRRLQYMRGA